MKKYVSEKAVNFYLKEMLKKEIEYKTCLSDNTDIEQSNEAIEELKNVINSNRLSEIVKEYNDTINKLEELINKSHKLNYHIGKYIDKK